MCLQKQLRSSKSGKVYCTCQTSTMEVIAKIVNTAQKMKFSIKDFFSSPTHPRYLALFEIFLWSG